MKAAIVIVCSIALAILLFWAQFRAMPTDLGPDGGETETATQSVPAEPAEAAAEVAPEPEVDVHGAVGLEELLDELFAAEELPITGDLGDSPIIVVAAANAEEASSLAREMLGLPAELALDELECRPRGDQQACAFAVGTVE